MRRSTRIVLHPPASGRRVLLSGLGAAPSPLGLATFSRLRTSSGPGSTDATRNPLSHTCTTHATPSSLHALRALHTSAQTGAQALPAWDFDEKEYPNPPPPPTPLTPRRRDEEKGGGKFEGPGKKEGSVATQPARRAAWRPSTSSKTGWGSHRPPRSPVIESSSADPTDAQLDSLALDSTPSACGSDAPVGDWENAWDVPDLLAGLLGSSPSHSGVLAEGEDWVDALMGPMPEKETGVKEELYVGEPDETADAHMTGGDIMEVPMPEMPPLENLPSGGWTERRPSALELAKSDAVAEAAERSETPDVELAPPPSVAVDTTAYPPPPHPALEPDGYPPSHLTRFDWRLLSPSQHRPPIPKPTPDKPHPVDRWFPNLPNRFTPRNTKLLPGDPYHAELHAYETHFVKLLEAEKAEEERLWKERLKDWSRERLAREGFMLDNMKGSFGWRSEGTRKSGYVYRFFVGRGRGLVAPKFTVGQVVIVSKSHPLEDPVKNTSGGTVIGSVYSVHKMGINIMFPERIAVEDEKWRLDIGSSDYILTKQIEAIKAFNLDPHEQDMSDYFRRERIAEAEASAAAAASASSSTGRKRISQDEIQQTFAHHAESNRSRMQIALKGTALRAQLLRAFRGGVTPAHMARVELGEEARKIGVEPDPTDTPHHLHQHFSLPSPKDVGDPAQVPATALAPTPTHTEAKGVSDGIVPPAHDLAPSDLDTTPNPHREVPVVQRRAGGGSLARNELIRSWTERHRSEREVVPHVEGDPFVPLNRTQLRAIGMMLSEPLSLVQGPPGTGKTRVIIETIKLLKHHFQIPHPILVCAHTNVAVDNLVSGLTRHGVKALRIGQPLRVREDLREWTLEQRAKQHPLYWKVEYFARERGKILELKGEGLTAEDREKLDIFRKRMSVSRHFMERDLLVDADVICTTCLSATSYMLSSIDFPFVFLDEASMATEPLSLLPLMKGSSHVAIIGDHKQLPPVIISKEAHAGGLSTSLFERLIHEGNVPSIMLDTQYRMHPLLSAFPSSTFYSSLLHDGTPAEDRPAPETAYLQSEESIKDPVTGELLDAGGFKNMSFIHHSHEESPMMKSIANYGDAEIVIDVVTDLLKRNPDLKGSDIGIITPYIAQINVLSTNISATRTRDALAAILGPDRAQEVNDIEIKTVDGFEGREKEVVVFSTVRSNAGGWIGFLGDWRRVNVGLTRAKRGLIMVGNKKTLAAANMGELAGEALPQGGAQVWKDFMKFLEDKDLIIDA
ncbi:hypothetical protein IAT38_002029 [Cryptococcus sp. DSM 104549]